MWSGKREYLCRDRAEGLEYMDLDDRKRACSECCGVASTMFDIVLRIQPRLFLPTDTNCSYRLESIIMQC
jgi:hypothetical protein